MAQVFDLAGITNTAGAPLLRSLQGRDMIGGCSTEPLSMSASIKNQLVGISYDAAGNVLNDGNGNTPTYDAENRIVTDAGYTYSYDADGARLEKAMGSTGTMYWLGPGGEVLTETDLTGTINEEYVYLNGARIARVDRPSGTVHFYFSNHLGSHTVVTSLTGSCEQDIDYYPYGGVVTDHCPTVAQHYKFTGKERDTESGLDNFGKRYFASSMGRWMSPDLVNVTEDRLVNPANTLNKYVYGGNNPLKYIDPDGQDITYFYDPGIPAGHAVLYAYNQASGDSAIESFGPKPSFLVSAGESNFDLDKFSSAQGLRDNYASLTIQTTPELAQQVIDYIRANPDPSVWSFTGPNCSSEVAKILKQFKLDNQSKWDIRQGLSPKILWHSLMSRYNPSQNHWGTTPNRGQDYGNSRFDMFNLLWFSLPQAEPKATVTTTSTNCVTEENGNKTCDTQ